MNTTDGLISVIVPVFNKEDSLDECIKSIQAQSYTKLEIILVNDGSTDKSGDICELLAQNDDRIKVLYKENGGAGSARNAGLEAAQGEFIAFVDSDDTIEANMYELLYNKLINDDVDMCVCGLKMIYEDYTRIINVPDEKKVNIQELFTAYLSDFRTYGILFFGPCNKLMRKLPVRFPEDYKNAEDGVYIADCIEASKNGISFLNIAPYNYFQSINASSLSKNDTYDNVNRMMTHLKSIMEKTLPEKTADIDRIFTFQQLVNKMITVHVAVTNKLKPPFKIKWSMMISIVRESTNREEKLSALLLYFLPKPLYRFSYKLYCKRNKS